MKRKFAILLTAAATLLASCVYSCPECNGTGFVNRRGYNGGKIRSERCPSCDGSGVQKYSLGEGIRDGLDIANSIDRVSSGHHHHHRYY